MTDEELARAFTELVERHEQSGGPPHLVQEPHGCYATYVRLDYWGTNRGCLLCEASRHFPRHVHSTDVATWSADYGPRWRRFLRRALAAAVSHRLRGARLVD